MKQIEPSYSSIYFRELSNGFEMIVRTGEQEWSLFGYLSFRHVGPGETYKWFIDLKDDHSTADASEAYEHLAEAMMDARLCYMDREEGG